MIDNQQIADNRFQEILQLEGYSLTDPLAHWEFVPFLKDGTQFPEFFDQEIELSERTMKELVNDPHSNIRIIYFQVFRLADEADDDSFLTNLKRKVFSVDFDIMFTPESDANRNIFNDFQFKRFFAEFVTIFQQNTYQPIEELIQKYPIMDQVFIHILRSILATRGIEETFETKIPTETVFKILGVELGLDVVSYGSCWKFEDADMVCYQGPSQELYIVYSVKQSNAPQQEAQITYTDPLAKYTSASNYQVGGSLQGYIQNFDVQTPYVPPATTHETVSYTVTDPVTSTHTTTYSSNLGDYPSSSYSSYTTTYNTSYEPYTASSYETTSYEYTKPIESVSASINLDIYKEDEKTNALVNKYLNISTNPEDIIGSKYTTSYHTPDKVETTSYEQYSTSYQPLYKTEEPAITDYKYTSYSSQESNDLLSKYSGLDDSLGRLNIGSSSYTSSYSTNPIGDYSSSYTSSYVSESYSTNYEQK